MRFTPSLRPFLQEALREDIGRGDLTSKLLIPKNLWGECEIVLKGLGSASGSLRKGSLAILSGLSLLKALFKILSARIKIQLLASDGNAVPRGVCVARLWGPLRPIFAGERVALNLLGHLSGVATFTRRFVDALRPYRVRVFDTRKTLPHLRELQKYAVRCGGGFNHRMRLDESLFVKTNHLRALGCNWESVLNRVPSERGGRKLIVEVESLRFLPSAIRLQPDVILLDNMSPTEVKQAQKILASVGGGRQRGSRKKRHAVELEASGGIHLENIRLYGAAGIRRLSVGALTHSAGSLDFSLRVVRTFQKKTFR